MKSEIKNNRKGLKSGKISKNTITEMKYVNITQSLLSELFDECNKEFFDNTLPKVEFKISNSIHRLGYCSVRKDKVFISISKYYKVSRDDVKNIMIHEMIHLWEWITFKKMSHTITFKNKATEIDRISKGKYKITRLTSRKGFERENPDKFKNKLYMVLKRIDDSSVDLPFVVVMSCTENVATQYKNKNKELSKYEIMGFVRNRYERDFDDLPTIKDPYIIRGRKIEMETFTEQYKDFINSLAA